jgi:hypothetical protein
VADLRLWQVFRKSLPYNLIQTKLGIGESVIPEGIRVFMEDPFETRSKYDVLQAYFEFGWQRAERFLAIFSGPLQKRFTICCNPKSALSILKEEANIVFQRVVLICNVRSSITNRNRHR